MANEDNLKAEEKAVYTEGGAVMQVEIVEDKCDAIQESYRLRVLIVASAHSTGASKKVGCEFDVMRKRDFPPLWQLKKLPSTPEPQPHKPSNKEVAESMKPHCDAIRDILLTHDGGVDERSLAEGIINSMHTYLDGQGIDAGFEPVDFKKIPLKEKVMRLLVDAINEDLGPNDKKVNIFTSYEWAVKDRDRLTVKMIERLGTFIKTENRYKVAIEALPKIVIEAINRENLPPNSHKHVLSVAERITEGIRGIQIAHGQL